MIAYCLGTVLRKKMSMLTCYIANRDVTCNTLYVCNVSSTGRMETVQGFWDICDELANVRPSTQISPKMHTELYVLNSVTIKLNFCI
jgi:hypothetical protein